MTWTPLACLMTLSLCIILQHFDAAAMNHACDKHDAPHSIISKHVSAFLRYIATRALVAIAYNIDFSRCDAQFEFTLHDRDPISSMNRKRVLSKNRRWTYDLTYNTKLGIVSWNTKQVNELHETKKQISIYTQTTQTSQWTKRITQCIFWVQYHVSVQLLQYKWD